MVIKLSNYILYGKYSNPINDTSSNKVSLISFGEVQTVEVTPMIQFMSPLGDLNTKSLNIYK